MPFSNTIREEALAKAKRHCCICYQFAGHPANVHPIIQESEGGPNTLENAIVLCPKCHAEAEHFNTKQSLASKYSPNELVRHRDTWDESCANGTAHYSSTVESQVKQTYTTADLHKYALLFDYHNNNKSIVSGWRLAIFIPYKVPVFVEDLEKHLTEEIDGIHYRKFQIRGTEPVNLGESTEITDLQLRKIEYEINQDVYVSAKANDLKIIWHFYSSSEPPIAGEIEWDEMQVF